MATNNHWSSCASKKRYRDEHTANLLRRKYEQLRGKKLDYYWCPYCRGFHLTSAKFIVPENMKEYEADYVTECC